ncbi:GCN5-related N-acetyltransferase [Thalassoporum mexicanum PCC 7367]|uniref:GNAT family N-acetyltransferase n=1 Tax=Thalassoporum mexicanum TaxID=3457544 RepID=UPI00029FA935|nr:GNAT family N-acetyltransferase [Pseudanabaena sp. PCC 7367]AFY69595.1 GCN5-related N-acetyltransferase [Pseudanabaena sp. PCC 7367]
MINLPIESDRLVIRKFIPADLEPYLEFMLDPDSTKYLAFEPEQKTSAGATDLFNYVVSSYAAENPAEIIHAYAIALKQDDRYVGSCGFSPYEPPDIYECYYSINQADRHKGYAYEAMQALIRALANTQAINELRAYCAPANLASIKLAQKLGMSDRGSAKHMHSGLDGVMYAIQLTN